MATAAISPSCISGISVARTSITARTRSSCAPTPSSSSLWAPEFEIGEQTHGGLTFRNYPLRYWVDYVRQLGGEEPAVLVVQTRCDSHRDRRPCAVDDDALAKAFGSGYCEVLQFSALNDRGLAGLRERLGEAIEFSARTPWRRANRRVSAKGQGAIGGDCETKTPSCGKNRGAPAG